MGGVGPVSRPSNRGVTLGWAAPVSLPTGELARCGARQRVVRLTDNTLSGYTVGVQRSDAVQVQSQGNSFWANGQHAVGVTLDGSTRYTP